MFAAAKATLPGPSTLIPPAPLITPLKSTAPVVPGTEETRFTVWFSVIAPEKFEFCVTPGATPR